MILSSLGFLRFLKRVIRAGIITGEITVYLEKLSNVYDTVYWVIPVKGSPLYLFL